jgi:hypothetical protein
MSDSRSKSVCWRASYASLGGGLDSSKGLLGWLLLSVLLLVVGEAEGEGTLVRAVVAALPVVVAVLN